MRRKAPTKREKRRERGNNKEGKRVKDRRRKTHCDGREERKKKWETKL